MLELDDVLIDPRNPFGSFRKSNPVSRSCMPLVDRSEFASIVMTRLVFKNRCVVYEGVDLSYIQTDKTVMRCDAVRKNAARLILKVACWWIRNLSLREAVIFLTATKEVKEKMAEEKLYSRINVDPTGSLDKL